MKHDQIRRSVVAAYDRYVEGLRPAAPTRQHSPEFWSAVHQRGKFLSCGRTVPLRDGREITHWCRRPVCPTCADYFGRRLARKLTAAHPNARHDDFRMFTLVKCIVPNLDDGFDEAKAMRKAMRNAIDYRRSPRSGEIDQAAWREFGIVGMFEFDMFDAENFVKLGPRKQEQYRSLGFDRQTQAEGPFWVVTAHGLAYIGSLGYEPVKAVLSRIAPIVHFRGLDEGQSLAQAAEAVGGYSAKVGITTALAFGAIDEWPTEVLADYIAATLRNSHGRQGFRLQILPKKKRRFRQDKGSSKSSNSDEPMPILIG